MSTISSITATQPSISATAGKSAAQQISATSSQPKANASSSVTISPSGTIYMNYEQQMATAQEAQNKHVADAFSDPLWGAKYA